MGVLGQKLATHSALAALVPSLAGRLLLARRRGGLRRTPAAAVPAPAAPDGGAASDAPPRAMPDEHRRPPQQGSQVRQGLIGYFLVSAVFCAFTGSPGMACLMLIALLTTLTIFG